MKYLELSGIQKQIRHWRGIAKKFSDDTPYSKGPNPRMVEKAENKLVQLEGQSNSPEKVKAKENLSRARARFQATQI